MIIITTTTPRTYDLVIIKNYKVRSTIYDATVRMSKTKTLDGGVVIIHSGFTDGDRTINIDTRLTEDVITALKDIFENQTFINLAMPEGLFDAAIRRVKSDGGVAEIQIEIKKKLA